MSDHPKLHILLKKSFNLEEIAMLCFQLKAEVDDIPGATLETKALELIKYMDRRNRLGELLQALQEARPKTIWPALEQLATDISSNVEAIPIADSVIGNFEANTLINDDALSVNDMVISTPLADEQNQKIKINNEDKDSFIFAFNKHRSLITEYYSRISRNAHRIDIIALTMQALLDNHGDNTIIGWIMRGANIRILIPSPLSEAIKIKSDEEMVDVSKKSIRYIEMLRDCVYNEIRKQIKAGRKCAGSLELRFHNGLPYFAYHNADNEMIIGLYYAHLKGLQSDSLYIGEKSPVYTRMQNHFKKVWEGKGEDLPIVERIVCRISQNDAQFVDIDDLKKKASNQ